jgi:hypothetical protein
MNLGKLVTVNVRDAWKHEALDFTPWLAEHLAELSDVIGIAMELEGVEVNVGSFSADILARDAQTDAMILIENQLEGSDHSHLGQIMTYLAGLNARTVIWIATSFRDAHLSALKWLNENTSDEFSFLAVQVKAVRIGDSPIAPVFEILEKPNRWERELVNARKQAGTSELGLKRQRFWQFFLDHFPDEKCSGAAFPQSSRWHKVANSDVVIAYYLARREVGLFIRGPFGAAPHVIADTLLPFCEELESRLGTAMGDSTKGKLFSSKLAIDTDDEATWMTAANWLADRIDRYRRALTGITQ